MSEQMNLRQVVTVKGISKVCLNPLPNGNYIRCMMSVIHLCLKMQTFSGDLLIFIS